MIRPTCAVLAVAMLAVAACDDAAAPAGRAGSVTVSVYIDRDATGTMTDGDQPVADFDVQLEREGQVVATAATGTDGRATFTDVEPGGYRVVAVDAPPAGSVLTTSPSPSAVVNFQGSQPGVEFRFAFLPGALSGRVYRNDGGSPEYESGTDTPGAGVTVYLRSDDGGTPGDTITSTTVDADGAYSFSRLSPGSYFVEFEQLGAMNYGDAGRIHPIVIVGDAETALSATFTGSIFMTVAEARVAADNETVAVIGTITVPANTFTSGTGGVNSEIWVQDETGGIAVFSVPSASPDYPLGRVIEVVGTKTTFNGKEQISSPTIRLRGTAPVPAPLVVTGTQANSRADEGELVRIDDVEVTSLGSGTTAYDVNTLAPDGQVVKIRVATGTNIPRDFWVVGTRYDVIGVLSEFRGVAQIQPRSTNDMQGPISIASARMLDTGTVVTVAGNITVPPNIFTSGTGGANSEIWLQDATGGIAAFPVPSSESANLQLGDRIEVSGTLKSFSGQLQIGTIGFVPTVTKLTGNQVVSPRSLSGAEVLARTGEGELVVVDSLTVTNVPTGTSAAFTVTFTDPQGNSIQVRVASANTGLTRSSFVVGSTYTVTGILSQFNGTAQMKPRYSTDVVLQ